MTLWAVGLFLAVVAVLMTGYPVAFVLAGTSLAVALLGTLAGTFDTAFLTSLPNRLAGIMGNETLIAVPLFVFMGITLERSRIAEELLTTLSELFGGRHGALGFAVLLVGMLLAASTGIVGATVVTMGLLSLPAMLQRGYSPALASGTICASGTLGQIIPPSIVLVLLGDVLSSAYQKAQLEQGVFTPDTVSVGDLFAGALIPGLLLVLLYFVWLLGVSLVRPDAMPRSKEPVTQQLRVAKLLQSIAAPLVLVLAVLGSILTGIATPTEAAGVGAAGALLLALLRSELDFAALHDIAKRTTRVTAMVFMILIGASIFALVFRGFGGDEVVQTWLAQLPGGVVGAFVAVMLLMFIMGFVLDFIEITFVVVPIVGPTLLSMGLDPVWLGVMIALNLQTSFLTPPFGFALFYLRGVAPDSVPTSAIYRGVVPFIAIQILMLGLLAAFPELATWLPDRIYG
ncbi:MAG: TRAP transporter large permease subunit [Pseudomonadota bacterium]